MTYTRTGRLKKAPREQWARGLWSESPSGPGRARGLSLPHWGVGTPFFFPLHRASATIRAMTGHRKKTPPEHPTKRPEQPTSNVGASPLSCAEDSRGRAEPPAKILRSTKKMKSRRASRLRAKGGERRPHQVKVGPQDAPGGGASAAATCKRATPTRKKTASSNILTRYQRRKIQKPWCLSSSSTAMSKTGRGPPRPTAFCGGQGPLASAPPAAGPAPSAAGAAPPTTSRAAACCRPHPAPHPEEHP